MSGEHLGEPDPGPTPDPALLPSSHFGVGVERAGKGPEEAFHPFLHQLLLRHQLVAPMSSSGSATRHSECANPMCAKLCQQAGACWPEGTMCGHVLQHLFLEENTSGRILGGADSYLKPVCDAWVHSHVVWSS